MALKKSIRIIELNISLKLISPVFLLEQQEYITSQSERTGLAKCILLQ